VAPRAFERGCVHGVTDGMPAEATEAFAPSGSVAV
jgi:hypothetical protein